MEITSKTKKLLAGVTAVGIFTVGGGSAALAADSDASARSGTATADGVHHRGARRIAIGTAFMAAADTLGTTPQQLRAEMRGGPQSIATIAGEQAGAVKDAIVAALSAKVDDAVANGNLSSERAEKVKSRLSQVAGRSVNRVPGQHAAAQQ